MKPLMLGACLAALGAPALAQPYGQPDPYYDEGQGQPQPQQPPPQQPYGQGGYQGQNGYDQQEGGAYQPPPPPPAGQPGFQVYQGNPQYQPQPGYQGGYPGGDQGYGQYPPQYGYQGRAYQHYGGAAGGTRYTGRIGGAWRNDEGQYCVWREMTWQDARGRPAYRWVPRCR